MALAESIAFAPPQGVMVREFPAGADGAACVAVLGFQPVISFYLSFRDGTPDVERLFAKMKEIGHEHGDLQYAEACLELIKEGPQREEEMFEKTPSGPLLLTPFTRRCAALWQAQFGKRFTVQKTRRDVGKKRTGDKRARGMTAVDMAHAGATKRFLIIAGIGALGFAIWRKQEPGQTLIAGRAMGCEWKLLTDERIDTKQIRAKVATVVDADLGLRGGDLRAAERTFQLLTQATGRAGRADRPGRAVLQTWTPEHPVLMALAAGDRDAFVAAELAEREAAFLPPYGRLAAIILSSENAVAVEKLARELAGSIPNAERLEVYGPADAPLALVRGRRRKRLLVRADRDVDLQGFLRAWLARVKVPGSVRLTVDVDPYNFL